MLSLEVLLFFPDLLMELSDSADTLTYMFLRVLPTFTHLLFVHHEFSGGNWKGNLFHSDFLLKLGV